MAQTYDEMRTPQQRDYDELVMERVKAGIALLEREHGPDWVDKIDLKSLDLKEGSACVLGQVYADAASELDEDGYAWGNGYEYATLSGKVEGLCDENDADFGFYTDDDEWEPLQRAWEAALTPLVKRRESPDG